CFGEPNGFQNFLRKDDSDNFIHWDFNLKAGAEDVYVSSTSREIHFMLSEALTDENWRTLIVNLKEDYKRVATEKSSFQKKLEEWVIFPNKYVAIAQICADLHGSILDSIGGFEVSRPSGKSKRALAEYAKKLKKLGQRANVLNGNCLQLCLMTPILAE